MNPYQGCEHGCIYCYARNTHEYWGYSAGLDFERKIIVKEGAAEILKKEFDNTFPDNYEMDVSDFSSGTYFVKIQSSSENIIRKIIKE